MLGSDSTGGGVGIGVGASVAVGYGVGSPTVVGSAISAPGGAAVTAAPAAGVSSSTAGCRVQPTTAAARTSSSRGIVERLFIVRVISLEACVPGREYSPPARGLVKVV